MYPPDKRKISAKNAAREGCIFFVLYGYVKQNQLNCPFCSP